jgi:hypothetical protein
MSKIALSTGKERVVCGYKIKKMPIGAYLRAVARLEGLPDDLMDACFPGANLSGVLDNLSRLTENTLTTIIGGLLKSAPQYLLALISEISGVSVENLENDPMIGLDGLIDIIVAVVEVNKLGETLAKVKRLAPNLIPLAKPIFGFND